jgi:hypothetical protein
MPSAGVDVEAFMAGVGIAEWAVISVFVFMLGFVLFRSLLRAALTE